MKEDDQAFVKIRTAFRLRAMAEIKEGKRMCIKGAAGMDF